MKNSINVNEDIQAFNIEEKRLREEYLTARTNRFLIYLAINAVAGIVFLVAEMFYF